MYLGSKIQVVRNSHNRIAIYEGRLIDNVGSSDFHNHNHIGLHAVAQSV
jgi:hypothetical protein